MHIVVIGAGKFGQALARLIREYWPKAQFTLLDRKPGSSTVKDVETVAAATVVVLAVPISRLETVLEQIRPHLQAGTVVADVCTVKMYPARKMRQLLPHTVMLLATHPLFGPETLQTTGWKLEGLPLVIHPLRMDANRYATVLAELRATGLRVVEMDPELHDRLMARSQLLSLLVGVALQQMNLEPTPIDTLGFQKLLEVRSITGADAFILQDVLRYNPHARQTAERLLEVLHSLLEGEDSPSKP